MTFCAWCDDEFEATSFRQMYCSVDCRVAASKEKIIIRQTLNKRKNRMNKRRLCAGGCGTPLSIYNDSGICDNCIIHKRKMAQFIKDVKENLDN